jgi:hypothetical protein
MRTNQLVCGVGKHEGQGHYLNLACESLRLVQDSGIKSPALNYKLSVKISVHMARLLVNLGFRLVELTARREGEPGFRF